jgi:hypothetical protein
MKYSTPPSDARMTRQTIPTPASVRKLSEKILRTWRDDRTGELRRRSRQRFYRVIFPKARLRIVRANAPPSRCRSA